MSMKRSKSERPGLLSQVMAIVAGMWKRESHNEEEDLVQNSNDSENAPIGLPGSEWDFVCSASAAEEIAAGYDYATPWMVGDEGFHSLEQLHDIEDKSSHDNWIRYEDNGHDPYQ